MNKFDTLYNKIISEEKDGPAPWQHYAWDAEINFIKNWRHAEVDFDIKAFEKDKATGQLKPVNFTVKEFLPHRKPPTDGTKTPGVWLNFDIGKFGYCGGSWVNQNWYNMGKFSLGPFKCQDKNLIEKNYDQAADKTTLKFRIPKFYRAPYYIEGTITVTIPSNVIIPPEEETIPTLNMEKELNKMVSGVDY